MMQDKRADKAQPCVEWYKDNDKMLCLLQTDRVSTVFDLINETSAAFMALLLPLSEAQINCLPFEGSWTAAQLAAHVAKCNNAILQALDMEGSQSRGRSIERVAELKKVFLDLDTSIAWPDFLIPEPGRYKKEQLVAALNKSWLRLQERRLSVKPGAVIRFPGLGRVTKMELLYFVQYHTLRHVYQFKKILTFIQTAVDNHQ